MKNGWKDQTVAREQLYDSLFDPNETRNLANDAAHAKVLGDMRARLDRWMKRTTDPILLGPIKAPPGALANDPDGISPKEPPSPIS